MSLLFDNLTIGLCMKGSLAVVQRFLVSTCTDLLIKSCSTLQSLQLIQQYYISVAAFSSLLNMF